MLRSKVLLEIDDMLITVDPLTLRAELDKVVPDWTVSAIKEVPNDGVGREAARELDKTLSLERLSTFDGKTWVDALLTADDEPINAPGPEEKAALELAYALVAELYVKDRVCEGEVKMPVSIEALKTDKGLLVEFALGTGEVPEEALAGRLRLRDVPNPGLADDKIVGAREPLDVDWNVTETLDSVLRGETRSFELRVYVGIPEEGFNE